MSDSYPCIKCGKEVTNSHSSAVCCEICKKYQHRSCFTTKREYDAAKAEPLWMCSEECQSHLSVDKATLSGDGITDTNTLTLHKMMRGLILTNARSSYSHKMDFNHLSTRIDKLEDRVNHVGNYTKSKTAAVKAECTMEINELKNEIIQVKQHNLNNKAMCIGLTYQANDMQNILQAIEKYALDNNIENINIQSISNCFKIKSDKVSKTMIEFRNSFDKCQFINSIRSKRNKNNKNSIAVYEMVISEIRQLLDETRVCLGKYYEFIWTKNGRILLKKGKFKKTSEEADPVVNISNYQEMVKLRDQCNQYQLSYATVVKEAENMDTQDIPVDKQNQMNSTNFPSTSGHPSQLNHTVQNK